jgi:hypothetical protein
MRTDTPYDEIFAIVRAWLQAHVDEPLHGTSYDDNGGWGPSLHLDGLPAVGLRGPVIEFEDGPFEWTYDIANDDAFLAAAAELGISFDCGTSWALCVGRA